MEKTIMIDGKPVAFKATGSFPVRYRAEFGSDYFGDLAALEGIADDAAKLDSGVFYNAIYIAAKTSDPTLPGMIEWLDGFETFPVFKIYNELKDMFSANFVTTGKNARAAVAKK